MYVREQEQMSYLSTIPRYYVRFTTYGYYKGQIITINDKIKAKIVKVININNDDDLKLLDKYVRYSGYNKVSEWLRYVNKKYHGRIPRKLVFVELLW